MLEISWITYQGQDLNPQPRHHWRLKFKYGEGLQSKPKHEWRLKSKLGKGLTLKSKKWRTSEVQMWKRWNVQKWSKVEIRIWKRLKSRTVKKGDARSDPKSKLQVPGPNSRSQVQTLENKPADRLPHQWGSGGRRPCTGWGPNLLTKISRVHPEAMQMQCSPSSDISELLKLQKQSFSEIIFWRQFLENAGKTSLTHRSCNTLLLPNYSWKMPTARSPFLLKWMPWRH